MSKRSDAISFQRAFIRRYNQKQTELRLNKLLTRLRPVLNPFTDDSFPMLQEVRKAQVEMGRIMTQEERDRNNG